MALVLQMKEKDAIMIGNAVIRLEKAPKNGDQVRISIQAPRETKITRLGQIEDIRKELTVALPQNKGEQSC